jgi:hypothetical protein
MKSSPFRSGRTLALMSTFVFFGLFSTSNAQTIIGKWKGISTTIYLTPEGSAKTGKKMQVNLLAETGTILMELRSGHTFTITSSLVNDPTVNIIEGTWALTNDQLTLTSGPKYQTKNGNDSKTKSILIIGDELIIKENLPPGKMAIMMADRIETKYKKI